MSDLARIRDLLAAVGDGVGCRHAVHPDSGISVDLLIRLEVVQPINRGVPACEAHGCPLLGQCAHARDFAERRSGIAGRKFRLTPEGKAAAVDMEVLTRLAGERLDAEPLIDLLGDGPRTIFDLIAALVEKEVQALAAGRAPERRYTRREVGGYLRLMADLGMVEFDGITVRRNP